MRTGPFRIRPLVLLIAALALVAAACGGAEETSEPAATETATDAADQPTDAPATDTAAETPTEAAGGAGDGGGNGSLTIYYGLSRAEVEPFLEAFSATQEGGVVIESLRQPTEELMTTIELELAGGAARADVILATEAQLRALENEYDICMPYDPQGIEEVVQEFVDPDGVLVPVMAQFFGIQYNTDLVTGDAVPSGYADVLDPQFENRVIIADPRDSSSIHTQLYVLVNHLGETIGDPFGWTYVEQLGQLNPTTTASHGTIRDLVAAGEFSIGFQGNSAAALSIEAGEPTNFVWPEEGIPAEIQALCINENAENVETAQALADYLVSQDGQLAIQESTGVAPIRPDVDVTLPGDATMADIEDRIVMVDSDYISEHRQETADMFHEALAQ